MHGQRYWVENGELREGVADAPEISPKEQRKKFNAGHVRLTTSDLGTEIKWSVLSPCLSSLFFINDWLIVATGRFVLRFYASGWFEEFYETYNDVNRRLDEIILRGDRHFTSRTFVQEVEPTLPNLTPLLHDCLTKRVELEEYAIECAYEDNSRQFVVEKVGRKSPIGKFYGTYLSSFPCLQNGSYNDTVSQAYLQVINSGKPRCDHVMAAFRLPDNQVHWVPYQRLILPKLGHSSYPKVSVISEISPISFNVI
jgi:hypothetical protein